MSVAVSICAALSGKRLLSSDTGLATSLTWKLQGAEASELKWPAPEAFSESDGLYVTYGYGGD